MNAIYRSLTMPLFRIYKSNGNVSSVSVSISMGIVICELRVYDCEIELWKRRFERFLIKHKIIRYDMVTILKHLPIYTARCKEFVFVFRLKLINISYFLYSVQSAIISWWIYALSRCCHYCSIEFNICWTRSSFCFIVFDARNRFIIKYNYRSTWQYGINRSISSNSTESHWIFRWGM